MSSVTILAVILYAAVFASVSKFDQLAAVPKSLTGLDFDRGYEALSQVRRLKLHNPPAVSAHAVALDTLHGALVHQVMRGMNYMHLRGRVLIRMDGWLEGDCRPPVRTSSCILLKL